LYIILSEAAPMTMFPEFFCFKYTKQTQWFNLCVTNIPYAANFDISLSTHFRRPEKNNIFMHKKISRQLDAHQPDWKKEIQLTRFRGAQHRKSK
jgi:hypothetical protein